MVFAMFMPGLACAQFMAPQKSGTAAMPCCPKSKTTPMGVMLFRDCMKIDLQQAHNPPLLKKMDIAKQIFPIIQTPSLDKDFFSIKNYAVRGPPPERLSSLSAPTLPVFLATQRLRI